MFKAFGVKIRCPVVPTRPPLGSIRGRPSRASEHYLNGNARKTPATAGGSGWRRGEGKDLSRKRHHANARDGSLFHISD